MRETISKDTLEFVKSYVLNCCVDNSVGEPEEKVEYPF
jgi:hypothetical protein